mmetsp:Transcript_34612/g.72985  ORF Transcript_34612/g.72985 Transcript_34612/m.72985 type:complete len:175 (+) Transcript_34612:1255-1779(+)
MVMKEKAPRRHLLEALRLPFKQSSSSSPSWMDETSLALSLAHDSWTAANQINAQNEIFHQKSNAKLLTMDKKDMLERVADDNSSTDSRSISDREAFTTRPSLCRSRSERLSFENIKQMLPKPMRRRSFTMDGLRCVMSARSLLSENDDFDANSVLWDTNSDDDGTIATRRSIAF